MDEITQELRTLEAEIHELKNRIGRIEERLTQIHQMVEEHYRDFHAFKDKAEEMFLTEKAFNNWVNIAFSPIKAFVYGILGTIALGALFAGLSFLFKKSP